MATSLLTLIVDYPLTLEPESDLLLCDEVIGLLANGAHDLDPKASQLLASCQEYSQHTGISHRYSWLKALCSFLAMYLDAQDTPTRKLYYLVREEKLALAVEHPELFKV